MLHYFFSPFLFFERRRLSHPRSSSSSVARGIIPRMAPYPLAFYLRRRRCISPFPQPVLIERGNSLSALRQFPPSKAQSHFLLLLANKGGKGLKSWAFLFHVRAVLRPCAIVKSEKMGEGEKPFSGTEIFGEKLASNSCSYISPALLLL